jgi:hypothetical protein
MQWLKQSIFVIFCVFPSLLAFQKPSIFFSLDPPRADKPYSLRIISGIEGIPCESGADPPL